MFPAYISYYISENVGTLLTFLGLLSETYGVTKWPKHIYDNILFQHPNICDNTTYSGYKGKLEEDMFEKVRYIS